MINTAKTAAALALARRAHAGQLDKGGEPYIDHPLHVAEDMDTEEETCVAILHDVLEDSDFTADDLREIGMSEEVVAAVELLTHDEAIDYFDYIRAVRESPLAAKVKRADLEHNLDPDRLRRRMTMVDMKRRSRYLEALAILNGNDSENAFLFVDASGAAAFQHGAAPSPPVIHTPPAPPVPRASEIPPAAPLAASTSQPEECA